MKLKNFLGRCLAVASVLLGTTVPAAFAQSEVSSPKVAFIYPANAGETGPGADLSSAEQAAKTFFESKFVTSNEGDLEGVLLPTTSINSNNSLDAYKCVWIHVDRNISKGIRNLPSQFTNPGFLRVLYNYMTAGGNIYLSGQATQLITSIWRVNRSFDINCYDNPGDGGSTDDWGIGTRTHEGYTAPNHSIFDGLTQGDIPTDGNNFYFIGNGTRRRNFNSMWDLNTLTYKTGDEAEYKIDKFEKDNKAIVLASHSWDPNNVNMTQNYAGIVEFLPMFTYYFDQESNNGKGEFKSRPSGRVICNGIGSTLQWDINANDNFTANRDKLAVNILNYLSEVHQVESGKPNCQPNDDDAVDIPESTGLITMLILHKDDKALYETSDGTTLKYPQEVQAYEYFTRYIQSQFNDPGNNVTRARVLFTDEDGEYLEKIQFWGQEHVYGDEITADQKGQECIWVNIDRDMSHLNNDGEQYTYENLQEVCPELKNDRLIERLKRFVNQGGNLYLSKYACMLMEKLGRVQEGKGPNEALNHPKTQANHTWGVNVKFDGFDKFDHPIYMNIPDRIAGDNDNKNIDYLTYGTVLNLFKSSRSDEESKREDHNCVWHLQKYYNDNGTGGADQIARFETEHKARVLATWGHEEDEARHAAVIVEFKPAHEYTGGNDDKTDGPQRMTTFMEVAKRRGTILTNGVACYQWKAFEQEDNIFSHNVKSLTNNILAYLTPVAQRSPSDDGTTTGIDEVTDATDSTMPVYFNLQGVRIERPAQGIFIEVVGDKTRKIIVK